VARVTLPALRERREDILLLANHFLKEFNALHGKQVQSIAEPVRRAMVQFSWPGNVRQLRNVVESGVVQDTDGILRLDDLTDSDLVGTSSPNAAPAVVNGTDHLIGRPLSEVERYYCEKALEQTEGNREEAARLLGIGERTLYRQIQEWKLQDQIKEALEQSGGEVARAAELLGLKPATLERKLKKLGLGGGSADEDEDE
jgi:two-component system response regulator HydG